MNNEVKSNLIPEHRTIRAVLLVFIALMLGTFLYVIGSVAANASESRYEEGVHYRYYPNMPAKQNTVDEYLSVFCPGCNAVEANYGMWKPHIDDFIKVNRQHVNFMVGTSPDGMDAIARAIAINNLYQDRLQVSNGIVWDIFYMVHELKRKPTPRDIATVLQRHSRDDLDLQKISLSYPVRSNAAMMTRNQNAAQRSGMLNQVPTFVVNGQYRINLATLNEFGNPFQELAKLINYLNKHNPQGE